jgi:hypothetical protein
MNKSYAISKDIPKVECINHKIGKYRIRWDIQPHEDGVSFMEEDILHKPTLQEIKSIVIGGINKQTEEAIQGGFHWRDIPIWLSIENQLNYKTTYDLAVQTNGEALPVVFKFGDEDNPQYFKFEDMETFQDFYFKVVEYINNTLTAGWSKKDSINWDEYKI